MTTLLPAVQEENHHLPILGIILLQHTLLQHIPVSKEIMQCVEASLAVAEDTISASNFNVQSMPVLQFHLYHSKFIWLQLQATTCTTFLLRKH